MFYKKYYFSLSTSKFHNKYIVLPTICEIY